MDVLTTTGLDSKTAKAPQEGRGQPIVALRQTLLPSQQRKPGTTAYAPSLPSYAITRRQQVLAYAVIDSLGRNLTQRTGKTVDLNV